MHSCVCYERPPASPAVGGRGTISTITGQLSNYAGDEMDLTQRDKRTGRRDPDGLADYIRIWADF